VIRWILIPRWPVAGQRRPDCYSHALLRIAQPSTRVTPNYNPNNFSAAIDLRSTRLSVLSSEDGTEGHGAFEVQEAPITPTRTNARQHYAIGTPPHRQHHRYRQHQRPRPTPNANPELADPRGWPIAKIRRLRCVPTGTRSRHRERRHEVPCHFSFRWLKVAAPRVKARLA